VAAHPTSPIRNERLVRAVDGHFEQLDAVVGACVVRWIEDSRLDLHEARVLLALTTAARPMKPPEIAKLSGLDVDAAYKAVHSLHGRHLTCEESRLHRISERGRALMRSFADAREKGVRAYVRNLDADERRRLETALDTGPLVHGSGG
jgi:hypothetical protein